jgi:hypothetical protein
MMITTRHRFSMIAAFIVVAPCVAALHGFGAGGKNTAAQTPKAGGGKVFRAGAYAMDVTPVTFPVLVNGSFLERTATQAHDPLHARCLVLDDGTTRLAVVVVDSTKLPRDLIDQAKELASRATGIATNHILISATHTHSAPAAMGALGTPADEAYRKFLLPRLVEGIKQAAQRLAPARVGWGATQDFDHTHCRRWIMRPDYIRRDPFGQLTVRAMMQPGYQNPHFIAPSGPVDPDISLLSVQTPDGRPVALLANYSMHYFGAPPLSADYFGLFAEKIQKLIGADRGFVGIMSQGTSGDQMWQDFSQPGENYTLNSYAEGVAQAAYQAYRRIEYHDWVPLLMREAKIKLSYRLHDGGRLAWAGPIVAAMGDRKPGTLTEVYAKEQVMLSQNPIRELRLQAIRVGELGIAAIPNEVFALTGLKIKAQSPLPRTFTIALANGSEGYIPPPEQHVLGGYTTWEARSAGLEVQAEPKILNAVLGLLEEVSGKPRRAVADPRGGYVSAVLASKPLAYWRMNEFNGPTADDATGGGRAGVYEDGIAFYLEGPPSPQFSGAAINRAAHFAGGRLRGEFKELGQAYSVEMWFWNGLPHDARPVTGHLLSRRAVPRPVDNLTDAAGDHLSIGGTSANAGRLVFFNGHKMNQVVAGKTRLELKTWYHVVLVRDGNKVAVYLNGDAEPEISGEAGVSYQPGQDALLVGGRADNYASFEGKLDEVAVYDRALTPGEATAHWKAAGLRPKVAQAPPTDRK